MPTPRRYAPRPHHGKDTLLSKADRHLVSRFSYGITPKLAKDVRRAGGAQALVRAPAAAEGHQGQADRQARRTGGPACTAAPAELWQRQIDGIEGGWEVMDDYARWVLMRRMTSKRQLLEVMTEFWENHLHVAAVGDAQFMHRVDYGNTIRKHALGRFDQMLLATTTHPAMLIYLDAGESTKEHPNENLGRELLELHTVGAGNYSEKDVRDSARILTGYSVDYWESWRAVYNAEDHYRGKVKVKGFKDKNGKINGKAHHRRLPPLPRPPQGHRRAPRLEALREVHRRQAVQGAGPAAGAGLPGERHRDRPGAPRAGGLPGLPAGARQEGARPGRGRRRDLPRAGREDQEPVGRGGRRLGAAGAGLADRLDRHPAVLLGPPNGQPIDNESWSSPARLLASMRFHMGGAAAGPTRPPATASRSSGCPAGTRASTSSSTTCASSCCTSSRARGCSRPAAPRST